MIISSKIFQKTHYEVLSIKEDASYEEIRVSYKSAILNSHPDKVYNKSDSSRNYQEPKQEFLDVQKAWEVLSDVKLKAIYDKELQASREILELPANEIELGDMTLENDGDSQQLLYECRCGDYFLITSLDLKEMGILLDAVTLQLHSSIDSAPISVLIPCSSCSLRVRLIIDHFS
ncbi:DPH4 homolog [Zingiber officinale]|uniref:DPH4 homolog n=1 Tax=Zingiber officinale TaxID=94328 RepID=UPI001C4CEB67|nr:DPH4 homolog [Zingiber officinale]XP_042463783.1 DPH4 homolog [Zingiber officinale]XP_042463784.1 DPH4 homolog [Zingiber officinale]XP_042463785.1 DPH4 homolog [Zingiber officinale]